MWYSFLLILTEQKKGNAMKNHYHNEKHYHLDKLCHHKMLKRIKMYSSKYMWHMPELVGTHTESHTHLHVMNGVLIIDKLMKLTKFAFNVF